MPPQQGDQCVFCQLIDNPDQLKLVGETENFYAWLEVNPRAKGHTMVVPKEHTESVMDLSPSEYHEGMKLAREVVEKAEKGLGADGASITVNIKEAGGQMMPHAYIQVFPRFAEEENAGTPTGAIFPQKQELQNQLGELSETMSSVDVSFEESKKEKHPESQRFQEDNNSGSDESGQESEESISRQNTPQPLTQNVNHHSTKEEDDDEEDLTDGELNGKSIEWK
ncbi:MAG: histidine triad (HIT) family protein [Candidatus Nanohaloarchaea archaeon]|jgi:histidine triad (HIT) family protein